MPHGRAAFSFFTFFRHLLYFPNINSSIFRYFSDRPHLHLISASDMTKITGNLKLGSVDTILAVSFLWSKNDSLLSFRQTDGLMDEVAFQPTLNSNIDTTDPFHTKDQQKNVGSVSESCISLPNTFDYQNHIADFTTQAQSQNCGQFNIFVFEEFISLALYCIWRKD